MEAADFSSLLLVDDDTVFCRVLGQALARRGFTVATAHGGAAALLSAQAEPPDYAVVDLNLAGFDDLQMIPGVGNKLAAEIVALREKTGRFNRLEELTQIKGIKEKKMEKLRNYLYVDGPQGF